MTTRNQTELEANGFFGDRPINSASEACPLANRGDLIILTDVVAEDSEEPEYLYKLRATDGSYAQSLSTRTNHVGEDNWVDLVFEDMPTEASYTLTVQYLEGEEKVLFENIPYPELSDESARLDANVIGTEVQRVEIPEGNQESSERMADD